MSQLVQSLFKFNMVGAATRKGGMGFKGDLPWQRKLKKELDYFKNLTTKVQDVSKQNAVIMARKTWDSIPKRLRPLKDRINIVVTRNKDLTEEILKESAIPAASFEEALQIASNPLKVEQVFIIGGSSLFQEALKSPHLDRIYLTQVLKHFDCDVFIPQISEDQFDLESESEVQIESEIPYQFLTYQRKSQLQKVDEHEMKSVARIPHEEYQYLDLIRSIMMNGNSKGDRTGTGTISLFGAHMRFSLRNNQFPLLTTKRVFWRGVVEELLWLIRGCTDSKQLADKKVHVWDDNGNKQFLDKLGFTDREEGDLGPG